MHVREIVKWVAGVAGISWPLAALFTFDGLLVLAWILTLSLIGILDLLGCRAPECLLGLAILIGILVGVAPILLAAWTVGYAVLDHFTQKK